MNTLPYDYQRCRPEQPDSNCRQCLRWADLPAQTWGPRTPSTSRSSSTDEHCSYIPIKEQKQ